jgi:ABC-type amino acid transport substrate-binding protein
LKKKEIMTKKNKSFHVSSILSKYIITTGIVIIFLSFLFTGCGDLKDGGNIGTGDLSIIETPDKDSMDESIETESANNSIVSETGDDTINKNILIAGTDSTFPPFAFTDDGQIIGFDVDIINEIGARLGKQIEIKTSKWDLEYKELLNGNLDIVISAVPYNEEKESIVDFSIPYYNMNFLLISLVGSEIQLKENLKGKNAGMLEASKDCLDKSYTADYNIVYFKDVIEMLDALKNREIDAVLLSLQIAMNLIKENKDKYIVLDETSSIKDYVIVFKNNSSLKPSVDEVIEEIKADGKYDEIYAKWFSYY